MGDGPRHARATARAARPPAPKKITHAKAARLVAIIADLKECEDITDSLSLALDDARAAISPFYD